MRVLVTGGAGFIGRHLSEVLLRANHEVSVIDDFSESKNRHIDERIKVYNLDLNNLENDEWLSKIDAVFHLQASISVSESVENPKKYIRNNIESAQNLFQCMKAARVNRLVYASSAAVYGNPNDVPLTENSATNPTSPYGVTKLAVEQLAHTYHVNHGFDVTAFRIFNPYGPGERHDPETHIVPNTIDAISEGKKIPMFWNGEQERDVFYVEDLAEGLVLGLNVDGFNVYNLSSGSSVKIADLVQQVAKIMNVSAKTEDLGERAGDPMKLMASIEKAKNELGWQPKTSLEEGLKITIEDRASLS